MKIKTLLALAALLPVCLTGCSQNGKPASRYAHLTELTRTEASAYAEELVGAWKDSVSSATAAAFSSRELVRGGHTMKLAWKVFGEEPADGRSLYISLHGGGGTAPEVNDQQWDNQQKLYQPAEGVYLCPRAITNTWDLHFRPESDGFYEEIIRMMVARLGVNPDKVYVMGYSAGGDGVWRLAPRMADHWAAASMMAGHPGDVSLLNLRNLPFMIWCGALDAAYDRNLRCTERIAEMDSLQKADPAGYVHEGHIVEGKEHWMDLVDAAAVPWMARYRRNPAPDKIVWRQEEELKPYFYWIGAPTGERARGKEVRVSRSGNTIAIEKCDYSALTVYLNDTMADLDKPVRVTYGDKVLFEGPVKRTPAVMRQTLRERQDPSFLYPVRIDVKL